MNLPSGAATRLLDPPSLEKSGVGRVLLDVGCIALLRGVQFAFCLRRVLAHFGLVTGTFVTAISGRHGGAFHCGATFDFSLGSG